MCCKNSNSIGLKSVANFVLFNYRLGIVKRSRSVGVPQYDIALTYALTFPIEVPLYLILHKTKASNYIKSAFLSTRLCVSRSRCRP